MVDAAGRELVFDVVDDSRGVEVREDGEQTSSVPVVSDTATVIALTCQVRDRIVRHFVVLIDKHLTSTQRHHITKVVTRKLFSGVQCKAGYFLKSSHPFLSFPFPLSARRQMASQIQLRLGEEL